MTLFVGDIHGEFEIFHNLVSRPQVLEYPGSIIQVGDFGHHPAWLKHSPFRPPPRKVYWIDGNHEWFPDLFGSELVTKLDIPHGYKTTDLRVARPAIKEPTELYPNCIYVPRGTVMEVDGRTMAFLGGGDSVDRQYRRMGWDWFTDERITVQQVEQLEANAKGKAVEVLVTHVPPYFMVPGLVMMGGHGHKIKEEYQYSSWMVERAWRKLGKPMLVCGHFHLSYTNDNVHVLDINEFKEL